MAQNFSLVRRPLRDDVRDEVMSRIVRGVHPAGSRIHEGKLAAELGVSRTPVREALMHLEQLGVLEVRPNSGFYVVPVTLADISEVYPMLGALESLGIRKTPADAFGDMIPRLAELVEAQRDARSRSTDAQDLDDQFHSLLISRCGNERLVATVTELKRVVHRYETGYMTDAESVAASAAQHNRIVQALRVGDIAAAADAVIDNWESGMERLLAWHELGAASAQA